MPARSTTHIQALVNFAEAIHNSAGNRLQNSTPLEALANHLGMSIQDHKFLRILTWIIAFCREAVDTIESSSLSEKNKGTASSNITALFNPFLPPFSGKVGTWYNSSLSATNQSYFDLLSDAIVDQFPIYIPDQETIDEHKSSLRDILVEMEKMNLPKWINDDFSQSIEMTIVAIEKIPFLAHRIIQDAHSSILARLFSDSTIENKRFMVKVATAINVVFAAFIMPFEAQEAGNYYYRWIGDSAVSQDQIDACAKPLALPAPSNGASLPHLPSQ